MSPHYRVKCETFICDWR